MIHLALSTLLPIVTGLSVAAIAGAFSLVGFFISKEQKISEFRQAWIDALRSDIAAYISRVMSVQARIDMTPVLDPKAFYQESHDDYLELNQAAMRIKLRLNSMEVESKLILESMTKLEGLLNASFAAVKDASPEIQGCLKRN